MSSVKLKQLKKAQKYGQGDVQWVMHLVYTYMKLMFFVHVPQFFDKLRSKKETKRIRKKFEIAQDDIVNMERIADLVYKIHCIDLRKTSSKHLDHNQAIDYDGYCRIIIHEFYPAAIGEIFRGISRAHWRKIDEYSDETLHLLLPVWNNSVIERSVQGYANERLIEILSRQYAMIYDNFEFWESILLLHSEKIEFANEHRDDEAVLVNQSHDFIKFTERERMEIEDRIKQMGLKEPFVCISARDTAYFTKHHIKYDNSYMDFRNSDILAFTRAVEYLSACSIQSVRVGKSVVKPFDNMNCIDYAAYWHDDLVDLHLAKSCKFSVGSDSGLLNMSQTLGKKCVTHDAVMMCTMNWHSYSSDDIFIPKKIYDTKQDRFLTFTEMWNLEITAPYYNENMRCGEPFYSNKMYKFIDNTSDEIYEAVKEMNERIDGVWVDDEESIELRNLYIEIRELWLMENSSRRSSFYKALPGAKFLKANKLMLEKAW